MEMINKYRDKQKKYVCSYVQVSHACSPMYAQGGVPICLYVILKYNCSSVQSTKWPKSFKKEPKKSKIKSFD